MYRGILALFLWCGVVLQTALCVEIKDTEFDFRCVIPEGFYEMAQNPYLKESLYQYFDGEPSPGDIPQIIQIQRLRGTLDPQQRLAKDKLPSHPGTKITLEEIPWSGLTLDIVRSEVGFSAADHYVGYVVQFPLAEEAILLRVSGPLEKDAEVRRLLKNVVGSFQALKPLPASTKPEQPDPPAPAALPAKPVAEETATSPSRELPAEERTRKTTSGLLKLAMIALALGVIIITAVQAIRHQRSKS